MRYRWPVTSRNFPELELFPSEKDLREAVRVGERCIRGWRYPVFVFWFAVVAHAVGFCFRSRQTGQVLTQPWFFRLLEPVGPALLLSAGIYGLYILKRRQIRSIFRERLNTLGVPVCIRCGYDLRGQTEPRCPECGTGFEWTKLKNELHPTH